MTTRIRTKLHVQQTQTHNNFRSKDKLSLCTFFIKGIFVSRHGLLDTFVLSSIIFYTAARVIMRYTRRIQD